MVSEAVNGPQIKLADRLERLTPEHEIERYCKGEADRALPEMDGWPTPWQDFVKAAYLRNKFKARLINTWVVQQLGAGRRLAEHPMPDDQGAPWNSLWWQKEQVQAVLTQIASDCRQRRIYGGWEDVLTFSGANVLVFLSICQERDLGLGNAGRGTE